MNLDLAKRADRILGSLLGHTLAFGDCVASLVRPPAPVDRVEHILLIKFWGLGNWALLRPLVGDVRARWPQARLTIATLAGNAPLVEDLADDVLLVRSDRLTRTLADLGRAVHALRRQPPDLAIDFEQFSRSGALLARLGRAAQRIGFASGHAGRDGLYTVTVPRRTDVHAARSFRDLVEAAGVAPGEPALGGLSVREAGVRERDALALTQPYVVLHPGSGDNFPGRRWSEAGFAAVGRAAVDAGRIVCVTGGAQEAELTGRIAAAIGPGARDLAGRCSLDGLVALLAEADALVANDTGPVHLASQLGVPVLALYGPNTPVLYGPRSEGSQAFYRDLPCSPCIRASNYRSSRCRIFTCMETIPTGEVVTALQHRLARADAERSHAPHAGEPHA